MAVETRHGIFRTMLVNQAANGIISFIIILFAFKWMCELEWGVKVIFSVAAFVHYTGIYSYSYSQTKIDLREKGKYDWLMPLKIGGIAALLIFVPAAIHGILISVSLKAGLAAGLFARIWNYSFFWFIYGINGDWFNWASVFTVSLLPIAVAYFSYYLGIKKFTFSEKIYKLMYRVEDKK